MEIKDLRVEYSMDATINIGNFQNVKPGYKLSGRIADGENPNEARAKLKATVDAWIAEDIAEHRAEMS